MKRAATALLKDMNMTKIQADHTLSSSSSSSTSSELLDWWNLSYNSYSRKLFTSSAQLQQLSSSTIYPESSSSSQLSQSLAILHNHLSHLELPPNNPNTLAVLQRAHSITLDLVDKAKRKTDALLQQLQPQLGPPPPSLPATITSMPRTHQPKMVIMPPPPPLDRASTSINTPLNNPTAFISPSLSSAITACSTSTSTAAITSAGPTTSSTAKRRKNPLSTSNPRALQASPTPPTPQLLHQPSMSPSFLNLSVYNPSDSSFIQEQKQVRDNLREYAIGKGILNFDQLDPFQMANLRQEQLIYLQQLQLKGDDGFVGDLSASTLINNSSDNNIPFQHHRASYSSTFVPSAPSIHPTKAIVPHPPSTINKSTTLQSRKPPPSITPHTSLSFKSSSLSNSSASTSTALQESRTVVREMLGDSLTSVEQLFVDQLLNSTAISGGGVINVAAVESSASKSSASSSASVDLTSFIQQPQPQQQQFIFPDQFKRYSYTNNSSAMLPSSFSSSVEDEGLPANSLPLLENDGDQMKLDDWIFDDIYNFNTGI